MPILLAVVLDATVVAPGYFRTDFLDRSSARFSGSARITDYTASTEAFRKRWPT